MDNNLRRSGLDSTGLLVGIALIVLGAFFLFGQVVGTLFGVHLGRFLWPFYILVPGALLFFFGLFGKTSAGEPLAMVGCMVAAIGLLLFFQNITGLWASWAYAWALIAPTSLGVGQMAYGLVKNRPETVNSGRRVATVGVIIFLAAAVFFELILGVSGFGLGRWAWSVLLIGLGVALLLRAIWPTLNRPE